MMSKRKADIKRTTETRPILHMFPNGHSEVIQTEVEVTSIQIGGAMKSGESFTVLYTMNMNTGEIEEAEVDDSQRPPDTE